MENLPPRTILEAVYAGQRLDKVLAVVWAIPRSQVQKLFKAGLIRRNDHVATANEIVVAEDVIEVSPGATQATAVVVIDPVVIHELPDYLVIAKPAGLLMHPLHVPGEPSVATFLIARYPELVGVGDDSLRPGIMHRLDRDVSGVVIIARTQDFFDYLKEQFQLRQVEKEYIAIVHGRFANPVGLIDFPLRRSVTSGRKMAALPKGHPEGKEAITEYEVIGTGRGRSLLRVIPKTGRTNQIRAHLAAVDHSIVGDRIYTTKKFLPKQRRGRILLHARRIAFSGQDGQNVEYVVEPSPDFMDELRLIKT
jgi:23S rRNA pseudouridine1911/1915/1917 synthase